MRQRLLLEGCYSYSKPFNDAVQQGLVLGPLLFKIYFNHLDGNYVNFADDTKTNEKCCILANPTRTDIWRVLWNVGTWRYRYIVPNAW